MVLSVYVGGASAGCDLDVRLGRRARCPVDLIIHHGVERCEAAFCSVQAFLRPNAVAFWRWDRR